MNKIKTLLWENLYPRQIVLKNAFWLYLSEIFSKGFRVIVFLLIARFLGPKDFGILEYLLSFIGLFFLFADFGISTIFIRDYQQKDEKDELLKNAFALKFFLSLLFSLIAFGGYFFAKKFDGFLLYSIFVIFHFLQNIENFFESYFVAIERVEKRFVFNTLASMALLIFIIVGFLFKKNIYAVAFAYLLSMILGLLIAYLFFKKEARLAFKFNLAWLKYYLFNGLPLALFGLLGYIFFSTDKIFLSHLRGIEETGYYSAASRIVGALFVVSSIFNTALYPYLARKVKENKKEINKLLGFLIGGSLVASFGLALITFLIAPILVPLIFGFKFLNSVLILQTFVWIIIFVYPTNFLDLLLISSNRQWLDFGLTIIPAFLNVFLNLIFIPQYGALGAVYASLISQALNFFLTLLATAYILRKNLSS